MHSAMTAHLTEIKLQVILLLNCDVSLVIKCVRLEIERKEESE